VGDIECAYGSLRPTSVWVIASPMRLDAGWNVSMGLRSHGPRTKRPFDPGNEKAASRLPILLPFGVTIG